MKGSSGRFVVDKVMEFLDECGCSRGDIVIKSDQEPAIKILVQDVVEARGDSRTLVEESPVKSSGSNGIVEGGVGEDVHRCMFTVTCVSLHVYRYTFIVTRSSVHVCR